MVRVAVIGAGFMGGVHSKAYTTVPDAELAVIYSPTPDRGQPLAQELGVPWSDNLDAILADPSIQAVDICLPTPQHRPVTEAALAADKHVLLEKPIALTLEDAQALVTLADNSNPIVMMAHVLRFWPEYVELARQAHAGDLGRLRSGFASRRQPFPAWSKLFSRSDLTGGAVIDMMIHDFDALNWVFGTPVAVTARGERNDRSGGGYDQVQVLIDYPNGASALVDGGMTLPESYPFSSRLEVLGSDAAMEYTFRAGGRSVEMGAGVNELVLYPNAGDPAVLEVPQADPYANECAAFVAAVQSGSSPDRATPRDGLIALATALAARQSLEQGGARVDVALA